MQYTHNPILVTLTRGAITESVHRGAFALVDDSGNTRLAVGDVLRPIYPRSAVKPLQALPLVETGAADHWHLGDAELAVACGSHSGEERHLKVIREWLAKVGLSEEHLECGPHFPISDIAASRLRENAASPRRIHNNCSGKHAGLLSTAVYRAEVTRGYLHREHPVQRRVGSVLSQVSGAELVRAPVGVDGCGIPVIGLPLHALALSMARFGTGSGLGAARSRGAQRLYQAMVREPFMVAGTGRWTTAAIEIGEGQFVVKTGAEGVCCAIVPSLGLGMALKIDDGAARAAEALMSELLARFAGLEEHGAAKLLALGQPTLYNAAGEAIGLTCVSGF